MVSCVIYLDCPFSFLCNFTLNKITLPAHREMDSVFLSNRAEYGLVMLIEVIPCSHEPTKTKLDSSFLSDRAGYNCDEAFLRVTGRNSRTIHPRAIRKKITNLWINDQKYNTLYAYNFNYENWLD